jgi:hypothetical protein
MQIKAVLLTLALITALFTTQAHAFRCQNGNLVLQGDTSLAVRAYCGPPAAQEYLGVVEIKGRYVNVDRYLYIPPSGQFLRIVEFHDGVVARVKLGRRVE